MRNIDKQWLLFQELMKVSAVYHDGDVLLGHDEAHGSDFGCKAYGYVNNGTIHVTRVEYEPPNEVDE